MTAAALVVPRARSARRLSPVLWTLPPLLLLTGFLLYPLALVAGESFTGDAWWSILTAGEFHRAIGNTVLIAAAATAGCVVLGTVFAVILALVPFPGAGAVSRAVDTFLAFPSFLIALSFTFLYGSAGLLGLSDFLYSRWCVILAEITFYTPFVMRPALAALSHLPAERLNVAASLGARPWQVLRRVVLPEIAPAVAAGGALTLLLTLNEFGIVLFIGAKDVITLPMLVHSKGVVTFDYPAACVVAVVEVALSVSLYLLYRWIFTRTGGRDARLDA
ncbi:2-aminoethylphosphonate ABC transporter permease subunit [Actinoplanes sp. NPDC024001]|uniref:2-aminoethylphosphonate ABC transporter permease subunit n=1 Tax=Actinoplanes sp. NPDC024001 TaxID=3154598 RepID=UPI0033F51A8F